jgi:hypothetical protein
LNECWSEEVKKKFTIIKNDIADYIITALVSNFIGEKEIA